MRVIRKIKDVVKGAIRTGDPQFIPNPTDEFCCSSYSQVGEDMVLQALYSGKTSGYYVDIGAHHPQRFSNTYLFYKKGWRGINIDALPGIMDKFNELRPRDINVQGAVSNQETTLTYHMFDEPAVNGFDENLAKAVQEQGKFKLLGTKQIVSETLAAILDRYSAEIPSIDFMSVDVEGLDLSVLKSNNWQKYRPRIVLAEDLFDLVLNDQMESPIREYLRSQGYRLWSKVFHTLFFVEESCLFNDENGTHIDTGKVVMSGKASNSA